MALPATLAALVVACASPTPTSLTNDDDQTSGPSTDKKETPEASKSPSQAPNTPTPATPATPGITTAKIHDAPVSDFVVSSDALWIATGSAVERSSLDGASPTRIAALEKASAIASDGARVYAFLDKGSVLELFSVKSDGSEGAHHSNWSRSNGVPGALTVNAGRAFFTATKANLSDSRIVSITTTVPAPGKNEIFTTEEYADANLIPPIFTSQHLFAVDYYRQSAVRVPLTDRSASVDVIEDEIPVTAGGIATDGAFVFTRTRQGIVKVPVGSGAGTEPIVVVPSATCSIFDPGDGFANNLEDTLAIDGATIYTACRAGANVEVRAYAATGGATSKVVASLPYAGGLTHLRVMSSAVYWLSRPDATTSASELWRAAK